MSSNPTLSTAAFKLSSQQERAWRQHEAGVSAFAQCLIAIDGILIRERESGWDVENGPSVRALLISTSTGTRLALTLPAFCADASTLKSLFLELASGYGGQTVDAGEIVQYADLVEWQNELLASDETKPGREFWRDLCR